MPKILIALAILCCSGIPSAAPADILVIDKIEAAPVDRPARGATMERVTQVFGAPRYVSGPVGTPPITRWDYSDFVVVFEHNRVIHSVEKPKRPPTPAP